MKNKAIALTLCGLMAGCAVTPERLRSNPQSVSDADLCRALEGGEAKRDPTFMYDIRIQMSRRWISDEQCGQIVSKSNAAIGAGFLLGAALVAASRGAGDGGGGSNSYAAQQYDTEWDWDQFYNQYRQLVWACRGVQTGQFADNWHCAGKAQIDWRWPQK